MMREILGHESLIEVQEQEWEQWDVNVQRPLKMTIEFYIILPVSARLKCVPSSK